MRVSVKALDALPVAADHGFMNDDTYEPRDPIRLAKPLYELIDEQAELIRNAARAGGADAISNVLREMSTMRSLLDPMIENFVNTMRTMREPWSAVGTALGVSKQAAWERYHHLDGLHPRGVIIESERESAARP